MCIRDREWSNTAAAAQYVAQECPPGVAAICSKEAAQEYGLQILQENIQNEAENTTRFIVISKDAILPEDAGKISLCFSQMCIRDSCGAACFWTTASACWRSWMS